jgi:diphthine synthase
MRVANEKNGGLISEKSLAVGIARAGSNKPLVKAGFIKDLIDVDFGSPLHCLILPGELHFLEAEALVILAGAPYKLISE